MRVYKIEVSDTGKVVETVVERDLPPLVAKSRAKSLNDARDSGEEDRDETGLVSYVAK